MGMSGYTVEADSCAYIMLDYCVVDFLDSGGHAIHMARICHDVLIAECSTKHWDHFFS